MFSSSSSESILPSAFQDDSACAQICPQLSYTQRIIGFVCCAGLGYVLSLVGTLTLIGGFSPTNVRIFIVLYVCGNVIALMATGFLVGPKTQCVKMWHPTRRYSAAFYLIMLIVVFAVAVSVKQPQYIWLILALLFIEVLAACWYSLSYIPFGRKMVLSCFRSTGICFVCFYVSDSIAEAQKSSTSTSGGAFFPASSK